MRSEPGERSERMRGLTAAVLLALASEIALLYWLGRAVA
jgi:hypothetical protein